MGDMADYIIESMLDDLYYNRSEDDWLPYGGARRSSDPNHYHVKMMFNQIISETPRMYFFEFEDGTRKYVPKRICRQLNRQARSVLIHQATYLRLPYHKSAAEDFT